MSEKGTLQFYFFALAPTGEGISGSDRIFIELARNWSEHTPVTIFTTEEGIKMVKRQKLKGRLLKVEKVEKGKLPVNFFFKYLYKIFLGINLGLSLQITNQRSQVTFIYSSSEFWMDSLPALILKIRHPNIKWIAAWYQTAPNPFKGFEENSTKVKVQRTPLESPRLLTGQGGRRQSRYSLSALFYWLMQFPIKPLISKFADKIIVNNKQEKKQFPNYTKRGDTIVLIGAVPLKEIENWKTSASSSLKIGNLPKVYDAVFQGRFHPQKGVVELIDIWKKVVEKIPYAKLAMIGDGPLMNKVKLQISNYKLQNNIVLFGYLFDGEEKYKIFSQSKIVVHPAYYDSGGMAAAEAMAFGVACVGFNLKAYNSYYPEGMIKAKIGDLDSFAHKITELIDNPKLRKDLGDKAKAMIYKNYSWDARAKEILQKIIN